MSKYKVGFYVNSGANAFSGNSEVVDLVDDWNYSEKEAENIIKNEEKMREIFEEWLWQTIETAYGHLETEEDVKEWERDSY